MQKIIDIVFFIVMFTLAVKLIEYKGDMLVNIAGDLFGALGLVIASLHAMDDSLPRK